MKPILAGLLLSFLLPQANASEEDPLFLTNTDIQAPVHDGGMVRLKIEHKDGKIASITVERDGKKTEFPAKEIALLKDFRYCDIQTTHEGGYPQAGGHTVHFKLSGFYREGDPFEGTAKIAEDKLVISIPKSAAPQLKRTPPANEGK